MARSAPSFRGARVALLEARLRAEAAAIVRRLGGEPVVAPALREARVDAGAPVDAFLDRLDAGGCDVAIFLTGVGVTALFDVAERLGRAADLSAALDRVVVVARGPKPTGALARRGVRGPMTVPEPYTTTELLQVLDGLRLEGRRVTVVHYGEPHTRLVEALAARGAAVDELLLYQWRLPDDVAPLSALVDDVIAGCVPVVAFTSQIQVRHLFDVAGPSRAGALAAALGARTLVGAIGPTCAEALRERHVEPRVIADPPKLVPLLNAMALAAAGA